VLLDDATQRRTGGRCGHVHRSSQHRRSPDSGCVLGMTQGVDDPTNNTCSHREASGSCGACGSLAARLTHTMTDQQATQNASSPSFAALRHPHYRVYFVATALAMMADNIEHVISYWVLFERFQGAMARGRSGAHPLAAVFIFLGRIRSAGRSLRQPAHHPSCDGAVYAGLARLGAALSY